LEPHVTTAVRAGNLPIRAAIRVVAAVVRLGLVGALVGGVEDAVFVVVGIRTAVFIFEAVSVFRIVWTQIIYVGCAVLIVVGLRAAVVVLETIAVLWIVGTLVDVVEERIAVAIRAWSFGTAVFVFKAVFVLRVVRAAIVRIENAVAIVVGIGATVVVLEPVEVLRIFGTLVDGIFDAITVTIAGVHLVCEVTRISRVVIAGG
jgi:hypothetical protein